MKKIFIAFAMLTAVSCSYLKGDYTLGRRNTFNDFFYTYNIRFFGADEAGGKQTESETVTNYKVGEVMSASVNGIMVSSMVMQKDRFVGEYVRPVKNGALVSYTVPVELNADKIYKVIGESEINDEYYRLLEPNRFGDVVLIDDFGRVYPRVGRIYNGRLALLETAFQSEPEDIRFEEVESGTTVDGKVLSGFEVRYAGIENGQMIFKFVNIRAHGKELLEEQKSYRFAECAKEISLDGIKLEVLSVSKERIEYKVISD